MDQLLTSNLVNEGGKILQSPPKALETTEANPRAQLENRNMLQDSLCPAAHPDGQDILEKSNEISNSFDIDLNQMSVRESKSNIKRVSEKESCRELINVSRGLETFEQLNAFESSHLSYANIISAPLSKLEDSIDFASSFLIGFSV